MAAIAVGLDADEECLPSATAPDSKLQVRVLLIEDNEESMWLVQLALQQFGSGRYMLDWVTNLNRGIEELEKGGVDLVLLDLGLPEASGAVSYELLHEKSPRTPVVVLTGDASEETELSVTAHGAEGYLIKDQVSPALLLQAIRAALYANKKRRTPPEPVEPVAASQEPCLQL